MPTAGHPAPPASPGPRVRVLPRPPGHTSNDIACQAREHRVTLIVGPSPHPEIHGQGQEAEDQIRPAGLPAPSPSGTAQPDRTDSPPVPTAGARADQGKAAPEGTRCRASSPHRPGSGSGHRLARHSPPSRRNPPSSPPALPAKAPRRYRGAQPERRCEKRPASGSASAGVKHQAAQSTIW